ncbi:uncharacterized protein RAG0_11402 [Rhynchosporium agropyri]|uniref:Uncharacterized protein n=1 Tax=Rhynchosporium agropyri TaxID=914238 RepID=A0A1E1L6J7_9HELO|nr:uncharacterized protein RAG0_11402 [Rhynchosporium agropyri]
MGFDGQQWSVTVSAIEFVFNLYYLDRRAENNPQNNHLPAHAVSPSHLLQRPPQLFLERSI